MDKDKKDFFIVERINKRPITFGKEERSIAYIKKDDWNSSSPNQELMILQDCTGLTPAIMCKKKNLRLLQYSRTVVNQ